MSFDEILDLTADVFSCQNQYIYEELFSKLATLVLDTAVDTAAPTRHSRIHAMVTSTPRRMPVVGAISLLRRSSAQKLKVSHFSLVLTFFFLTRIYHAPGINTSTLKR